MTSNFKLIKRFFELVNQYSRVRNNNDSDVDTLDFDSSVFQIQYRNLFNPDVVVVLNLNQWVYLFDYTICDGSLKELEIKSIKICGNNTNFSNSKIVPQNFETDLFSLDDLELLLMYGKDFTDIAIIDKLQNEYNFDISMDDFKNFLGE